MFERTALATESGMYLIRRRDDGNDPDDTPLYDEKFCERPGCLRHMHCDLCKRCDLHCDCFLLTPTDGPHQPEDKP